MPKLARLIVRMSLIITAVAGLFSVVMYAQLQNEKQKLGKQEVSLSQATTPPNDSLTADSDFTIGGDLIVKGFSELSGKIKLSEFQKLFSSVSTGRVLSVDENGYLVLVDDKFGNSTTTTVNTSVAEKELPTALVGGMIYFDGTSWKSERNMYNAGENIGIQTQSPAGTLHIDNNLASKVALIVQAESGQTASLTEWRDANGTNLASINAQGKLTIRQAQADHSIELFPTGHAGALSSSGGALFIDNTYNAGTGIGIYSNMGATAEGNMINVKVDNEEYGQAAFYMNYDGSSNAVEIVSNSDDTSSNALSVTGFNENDSTVGIIGYETGRGTVKITHNGTGNDDNASALSIDLAGTGTDAQGIYVDSTASGGTDGNLLRLRNQTLDRFVVSSLGSVTIGRNGTNTSVTKNGNTVGDEFFIGTNGAFRVQRSATDSEAFRTQIVGDTQGRWLGTSDGKLKFGDGSNAQDVTLERIGTAQMQLTGGLALTTNLNIGGTTFGTNADNVIALVNGTPPTTSITDGVQLFADDVASSSELRVRDEAGNVSTLSPHNFSLIPGGPSEDLAWSFYSEKGDIAINADITKALRLVEDFSGEKLIYMKNLQTGEEINNTKNLISINNDLLKTDIQKSLDEYLAKEELQKYVTLKTNLWEFISGVVFKAKTIFENSVEFLANATFKGNITVNADTAGVIVVPARTQNFEVNFKNAFPKKPLVYLSSLKSDVNYTVKDITPLGFKVEIQNIQEREVEIQWLALLSEGEGVSNFKIIDSSKETEVIAIPTPLPTPAVEVVPISSESAVLE